jgi:hypothetical protein
MQATRFKPTLPTTVKIWTPASGDPTPRIWVAPEPKIWVPDAPRIIAPPHDHLRMVEMLGRWKPMVSAVLLGAAFASLGAPIAKAQVRETPIETPSGPPVPTIADVQAAYDRAIRADRGLVDELNQVVGNALFQSFDYGLQTAIIDTIAAHRGDNRQETIRDTLVSLVISPAYQALPRDEKVRLLRYVGGTNQEVSEGAAFWLRGLIKGETYRTAEPATQTQQLQVFLRDQPNINYVASSTARNVETRAPYTLSDPSDAGTVAFRSGAAPGIKIAVTIGDKTIPVYLPAPGVEIAGFHPTIAQIADALAALPSANRALIKAVYANPGRSPDDAALSQAQGSAFVSYMTAGADGVVSIYAALGPTYPRNIDNSMVHETGHILGFKLFGNRYTDRGWDEWKTAITNDKLLPTGYARRSPGEDFSETLVLYLSSKADPIAHEELRALFPGRFAILDRVLR